MMKDLDKDIKDDFPSVGTLNYRIRPIGEDLASGGVAASPQHSCTGRYHTETDSCEYVGGCTECTVTGNLLYRCTRGNSGTYVSDCICL